MRHQHTIARPCVIEGRGYWTGDPVTVSVHPAAVDNGITLVRADLAGRPSCPALIEYQHETPLRTILGRGEARFEMVEHLLAALTALRIDNVRIDVTATELPGLDGSALAYTDALSAAGLILQSAPVQPLVLDATYRVGDGRAWVQASPPSGANSRYEYRLSFDDDTPIPPQIHASDDRPSTFIRHLAPARTFVTAAAAAAIQARGLARHVTATDLIIVEPDGTPRGGPLRFNDEYARHKTLDLIGDLRLCGHVVRGDFTSFRGGHVLNGRMAARLAALARQSEFLYKRAG